MPPNSEAARVIDGSGERSIASLIARVDWSRPVVWGLYLITAGMPLYVVRWHVGPLPTTLLEVLILATCVAYVARLRQERRLWLRRTPLDVPIALLLIAGLISIVVAFSPVAAAGIYRAYFLEAIAVFYIAVDVLDDARDVRGLLVAAGVASALFAIGQLVTFFVQFESGRLILTAPPTFVYTSSNSVALFLEPPLTFAAAFFLFPSRPQERWWALAFLLFLVPGGAATLSRGMYLAFVVLAIVAVVIARDARIKLAVTAIAAAAAITLVLIPVVRERFTSVGISFLQRLVIYEEAMTVLVQRPIFGAGLASYAQATAALRSQHQWPSIYPHNIWLAFWSETGLLGLLSFAATYVILFVKGWRALMRSSGFARPLLYGAVGTLIVYFVHGLVDTPYWKNDLAVEFWLVAALTLIGIRLRTAS